MDLISINDFLKTDIRVVKVVEAEPIVGKVKILKLKVEVEVGKFRTIVAGGAQYYPPEYFVGKKFIALINLAPKRIGGVESQGMLLAVEIGDKPVWLKAEEDAPSGAQVR